jgi:hypothetical protein
MKIGLGLYRHMLTCDYSDFAESVFLCCEPASDAQHRDTKTYTGRISPWQTPKSRGRADTSEP